MTRNERSFKLVTYGDRIAQIFVWQKAITLTPLWAMPLIPIAGFVFRSLGSFAAQAGFGLLLALAVVYFLEDLLKRKIRLSNEFLFLGFRAIPISAIASLDISFKRSKLLPNSLLINYGESSTMKFDFGGLTSEGATTVILHLQSRNSSLKTAPLLNALVKYRKLESRAIVSGDRLLLPYDSRRMIEEFVSVFMTTAGRWTCVGPLVTCVVFGQLWMGFLLAEYNCIQPLPTGVDTPTYLSSILNSVFVATGSILSKLLNAVAVPVGALAVDSTFFAIGGLSVVIAMLVFFRILLKPNFLSLDKSGAKLIFRLGDLSVPVKELKWAQVEKIGFEKSGAKFGRLRMVLRKKGYFDLALDAISSEDRCLLLRHIERFSPAVQIDDELSQIMSPKSERSYTEIWLQSLNQAPERQALEPLQPGQLIATNKFEVLKNIGVGGQGKAYLCRNLLDEKAELVVLKETILPIFADGGVRRRAIEGFAKEATLLKSLDDQGIVKLIDYFIEDHRAYLVLEHIDGSNLRQLVEREGLQSEERVRDLALKMCHILKVLHSNSIIHRDFTPDNLILNAKGQLKLIDFNVAQIAQASVTNSIVGKLSYLPPEQFRGKPSTQSDLYAMGATLFYLLTGSDPEPMSQSSPKTNNPQTSNTLNDIVKRATALQINNRYLTAEEIELALSCDMKLLNLDLPEVLQHG